MISDKSLRAAQGTQQRSAAAEEELATLLEIALRIEELRTKAPDICEERVWERIKREL